MKSVSFLWFFIVEIELGEMEYVSENDKNDFDILGKGWKMVS